MHARKARIPMQGRINIGRASNSLSQLPTMSQTHVWDSTNSKFGGRAESSFHTPSQPSTKTLKTSHKHSATQVESGLDSAVLNNVRKAYKGKSNIWRIARSWGFPQKGYIQKEELQEQLQKCLKTQVSQKECSEMFNYFARNNDRLDLEQFLSMIYSQPKDTILKPKLYDINDAKELRNSKILNLTLHRVEEDKNSQIDLVDENRVHRRQKSLELSLMSRKGAQDEFFTKNNFSLLSKSTKKHLLTTKRAKESFDPQAFVHVNQKKTRFGATPMPNLHKHSSKSQQSQVFIASTNKIVTDDKKNVQLKRFQKIREYQKVQKENIAQSQKRQKIRDEANLLRRRLDKEAYEYSAFLKNNWN